MKKTVVSLLAAGSIILSPAAAFAHVAVKPAQVGIGTFQTFQTGVPNEKDIAVTGVKLVIPAGLNEVSPNVKPGWEINVVKDGDTVKEIDWTGGSIPAGQRDDFVFSAQAPAKASTIAWKAYQTYADGSVTAWDQKPDGKHGVDSTPYSETKVVNDLAAAQSSSADSHNDSTDTSDKSNLGVILGIAGIALGATALVRQHKRE
jgi:uncharacterized protein YcnI